MGGGTSMMAVREDRPANAQGVQTTTLSLVPVGMGRAMMQVVFEASHGAAQALAEADRSREEVNARMSELTRSLFAFIEQHQGGGPAEPPAKKKCDPAELAAMRTRTCSAADEAGTLASLPVPVLRRWMGDYALDPAGCIEKSEMVARIESHCLPCAECYVCLEAYQAGDRVRRLPCKHEFHAGCVDRWLLDVHRTCPTCRQDVVSGEAPAPFAPAPSGRHPAGLEPLERVGELGALGDLPPPGPEADVVPTWTGRDPEPAPAPERGFLSGLDYSSSDDSGAD